MIKSKKFTIPLIIFIFILWGWFIWTEVEILNTNDKLKQKYAYISTNPCWFLNSEVSPPVESSVIKAREDRETYGYSTEISVGEAVRIFNAEQKCSPYFADQAPLTEKELVESIISAAKADKTNQPQKEALWKIAKQKIIPKGSLISGKGDDCQVNSSPSEEMIANKERRIYLFLNLDEKPRKSESFGTDQVFLVRK